MKSSRKLAVSEIFRNGIQENVQKRFPKSFTKHLRNVSALFREIVFLKPIPNLLELFTLIIQEILCEHHNQSFMKTL